MSKLHPVLGLTFFTNVYLNVPAIVIVHFVDNTPDAGIVMYLYCGLLNAINAIVVYFCPNIVCLSISKMKPSKKSSPYFCNPDSKGFEKNILAFKPLL